METRSLWLSLFLLLSITAFGCDSKPESKTVNTKSVDSKSVVIPADWDNLISLSKVKSSGVLKLALTGKKQTFNQIVEQIRMNQPKPIHFNTDVNCEQVLDVFEFKLDEGSWRELLALVTEKFNSVVEESETEFLVVPRN